MANCKYLLKLPGGETIELPAGFNSLDSDTEIEELYSKYKKESNEENKEKLFSTLFDSIKAKIPKEIHGITINNIIEKSNNIEEVYRKINNLILKLGTYENIDSAIMNYIKEGKENANSKLKKLRSKLLKEKDGKYFKEFGVTGVLGITNLKQEKDRIYSKNLENLEFGFNTEITSNLHTFLSSLNSKYFDERESNLLYGVRDSFIGKAWSNDGLVIYELDDDLSLFLGLFKKEAVKINIDNLVPILVKLNEIIETKKIDIKLNLNNFDIEEFFKGKVKNNKISTSIFEELLSLSKNKEISMQIDEILKLVTKSINPNKQGLFQAIKSLFWQLSPEDYGKGNLFKQLQDIRFVSEEAQIEQNFKANQLSFFEMGEEIDKHFSPRETIFENIYENSIKNIILNKDLVLFPHGDFGIFALVTHIYKRDDDQVAIYGVYKDKLGNIKNVDHVFKSGEVIYKKREIPTSEHNDNEIVVKQNGALIKSDIPINNKIIKEFVSKGDIVSGDLVLGVYPGYIKLKTPSGKIVFNKYKNIYSFSSFKLLQKIEQEKLSSKNEYKSYSEVKDSKDLVPGDSFLYDNKFYKTILFADKENVYSWVEDLKGNYIIKGTKREGLKGIKNTYGEITIGEVEIIKNEVDKIGRTEAKLSSFNDINSVKVGDYVYFKKENKNFFGKVLEYDKIVLFENVSKTKQILTLDYFENNNITPIFFTTRDISSNYSLFTIRANNWNVNFKKESGPLDVEVRYVVPVSISEEELKSLIIFPSNYANKGSYKKVSSIDSSKDLDITDIILKTLEKPSGTKIFVEKESETSDVYKRNLTSLIPMNYFDTLDKKTKLDLNVLVPGTYFSLYKNDGIDRNIYRIISIKDNIIKAQLNKMSPNGKIITNEVDLLLDNLLQDKSNNSISPSGSIAKLYLITGNSKVTAVFDETNKLLSKKNVEGRKGTNKSIELLIDKVRGYVKGLGIPIKLVSHSDIFKDGQYAAIVSELNDKNELKTSILISDKLGETEDVIHEVLHIFLTPLRYKYPDIYHQFISSVVKDNTLNVTDAEEEFVKFVSNSIERKEDFIENFENLQTFIEGLKTIITDVNPDFQINSEENPITLLKTSLRELFEIENINIKHPMYNLGLITTEPMMREWMKNNNITLNCF